MMERIDYVGAVMKDLEAPAKFLDILGSKQTKEVMTEQIKAAFISIGDSEIELSDTNLSIAKFIAERDEEIHHISLQVNEIEKAARAEKLKGKKN